MLEEAILIHWQLYAWLAEGDSVDELLIISRNIEKELPFGSDRFILKLEKKIGRMLSYRPLGRPRKPVDS
jgi:hypothetical protein